MLGLDLLDHLIAERAHFGGAADRERLGTLESIITSAVLIQFRQIKLGGKDLQVSDRIHGADTFLKRVVQVYPEFDKIGGRCARLVSATAVQRT